MLFKKSGQQEDPLKQKYAHLYVQHEPVYQTAEEKAEADAVLEANLSKVAVSEPSFVIKSPWRGIWVRPKETVAMILKGGYGAQAVAISMLSGVTYGFNHAQSQHLGESLGLLNILTMSIMTGIIGGALGLFGVAGILLFTGRWIGGTASYKDMWKTIGWASTPSAAAAFLWLLAILIFGDEFFRLQMTSVQNNYVLFGIYMMLVLAMFLMRLWQIVTTVACLAEVQQFSVAKAILNIFLAFAVILVPMVLMFVII